MTIDRLIVEINADMMNGRHMRAGEKMQVALEWSDKIKGLREVVPTAVPEAFLTVD